MDVAVKFLAIEENYQIAEEQAAALLIGRAGSNFRPLSVKERALLQ